MADHTFRDLETAAYCPRKLYYRRRDGAPEIPEAVAKRRALAREYERLLDDDTALLAAPIEPDPATVRERSRSERAAAGRSTGVCEGTSRTAPM